MRPPIKIHGGKYYLAKRIIKLFPEHSVYLEPFCGGASVLLNKPPCQVETINDIDCRISRLFRVLRDEGEDFVSLASLIPYSEGDFLASRRRWIAEDVGVYTEGDLGFALMDFILWRQSFGGQRKNWNYSTKRPRGGIAGNVNAWLSAVEMLPEIVARLQRVQIMCRPALEAIRVFDSPDTLIYCDPTYPAEARAKGADNVYEHEMSDDDHIELAEKLKCCESMVAISGYHCPMYDHLYESWRCIGFDIACHAAGGKEKARRTECVWMNYQEK